MAHNAEPLAPRLTEQLPGPAVAFDLTAEIEQLRSKEEWETGSSRRALVRYPDFLIRLTALKGGTRIAEHFNAGRICVHTVAGHIRTRALGKTFDLPQGRMLILDRAVRHDVEAVEDSAFLLTSVPPEASQH